MLTKAAFARVGEGAMAPRGNAALVGLLSQENIFRFCLCP